MNFIRYIVSTLLTKLFMAQIDDLNLAITNLTTNVTANAVAAAALVTSVTDVTARIAALPVGGPDLQPAIDAVNAQSNLVVAQTQVVNDQIGLINTLAH
jgi:hypothetical protein